VPTKDRTRRGKWKLACITGGDHLRRTLAMYHELGIETRLEEMIPEDCKGCTQCYQSGNERICRVYTRADDSRRSGSSEQEAT